MKLTMSKKTLGESIIAYFQNHTKAKTVKKFSDIQMTRQGIYKLINRYLKNGTTVRKSGSGRKAIKMKNNVKKKFIKSATGKVGQSCRKLGRQFNISKSYSAKIMKEKGLKFRKRKEVPMITAAQSERQKQRIIPLKQMVLQKTKLILFWMKNLILR